MKRTINVRELLDSAPDFKEAGYAAHYDINAALEENGEAVVDLAGVPVIPKAFVDTATWGIAERFGMDAFRKHVTLANATAAAAAQWPGHAGGKAAL